MINTKRYIIEAVGLATIITGLLLAITIAFTDNKINWLEIASVYFSFGSTWLCTRQVRFNYIFAVFATILLSITFWQAELYGSMALNLYLIPTVIYGWFVWGRDASPRPVEHVSWKRLPIYALVTAGVWLGALAVITKAGGELALLDGWLLVGTVLAQFLMDRKKLENWIVWAVVNMVSIYVYWNIGLHLLALQFMLFLLNSIIAWVQWRKTMAKVTPQEPITGLANVGATP